LCRAAPPCAAPTEASLPPPAQFDDPELELVTDAEEWRTLNVLFGVQVPCAPPPPPPLVLIGHAASLTPYLSDTPRSARTPSPFTDQDRVIHGPRRRRVPPFLSRRGGARTSASMRREQTFGFGARAAARLRTLGGLGGRGGEAGQGRTRGARAGAVVMRGHRSRKNQWLQGRCEHTRHVPCATHRARTSAPLSALHGGRDTSRRILSHPRAPRLATCGSRCATSRRRLPAPATVGANLCPCGSCRWTCSLSASLCLSLPFSPSLSLRPSLPPSLSLSPSPSLSLSLSLSPCAAMALSSLITGLIFSFCLFVFSYHQAAA